MKDEKFEAWLADKPENVQKLVREFSPGLVVYDAAGEPGYLFGYTEDDKLIFSQVNPALDYQGAMDGKKAVMSAQELRELRLNKSKH